MTYIFGHISNFAIEQGRSLKIFDKFIRKYLHNAFEDNVGMQMGIGSMKKIIQYGNESNRFNVKSICMQQFSNGKGSKGYY